MPAHPALGAHTRAARAARMYCVLYGRATTTIQLILSTGTYHTIVWSRCNDHTTYIQSDRDLAHPRLQNRGPISVSKSRSIHTITYKIVDLHNIVCKDRDFARTAILQPTHVQACLGISMGTIYVVTALCSHSLWLFLMCSVNSARARPTE